MVHRPVLLQETLQMLKIIPDGFYIDATFGQGGHTKALLEKLNNCGHVLALDKDFEAKQYSLQQEFLSEKFSFEHTSFANIKQYAQQYNVVGKVNGILLDLGTSATQLDDEKRGFSFLKEGPLDMRMNTKKGITASQWIAKASLSEMYSVFYRYGEERWTKRIAQAIDRERKRNSITTTSHLAKIIQDAHPKWSFKIHPATRVFQAIRIHINQELDELNQCLTQSSEILASGGKLLIITFHSLEARQIKHFMQKTVHNDTNILYPLRWSAKGIKPTREEILNNRRARSAILRVIEKPL